jgi:hypothetical protein
MRQIRGRRKQRDRERLWAEQDGRCGICRRIMDEVEKPTNETIADKDLSPLLPVLVVKEKRLICYQCHKRRTT